MLVEASRRIFKLFFFPRRKTGYQRLAGSDQISCHSLLHPPTSPSSSFSLLSPFSVTIFLALIWYHLNQLHPELPEHLRRDSGSRYRSFTRVGQPQARKFSLGWLPGGRFELFSRADPAGEDSWEELRHIPGASLQAPTSYPTPKLTVPWPLLGLLTSCWVAYLLQAPVFWRLWQGRFSKCGLCTTRGSQGDFMGAGANTIKCDSHIFILIGVRKIKVPQTGF